MISEEYSYPNNYDKLSISVNMPKLNANLVKDVALSNSPLSSRGALTIVGDNESSLPIDLLMVLDVSGSMSGDGITVLTESVIHTLDHLLRPQDKLAIITFNNSAKIHTNWTDKSGTVPPFTSSGGTNFGSAIKETLSFLGSHGRDESRAGIVLFLSDGHSSMPNAANVSAITEFGFTMHTLGVTSGANPKHLEEMAELARGYYFDAPDFNDVKKAFGSLFNYGKTVVYAAPDLGIKISDGVTLSELVQTPQGVKIHEDALMAGDHTVSLTHMVQDSTGQLAFKINVDNVSDGDNLLAVFDCIGGSTELRVKGTLDKTELLESPPNLDVTLITKTSDVTGLLKTGDKAGATRVITQIETLQKKHPGAGSVTKTLTEVANANSDGERLETLGKLKTTKDGKTELRED